ncbi:MAG TPA: substrate-binding domain-containing protein [Ruminococcus flavefaciens]|nr:substrate-binding domain-containing protein [Ruminococcus flavefaciens]HQM01793.1 substrate-binding domain-containing protein [Ruminococcus flavefaciens]
MKKKPLIGIVTPILARDHIRSIVRGALAQINACGCDCIVLAPLCHLTQCAADHAAVERSIYRLIQSDAFDGFLYVKDDTTMGDEVTAEVESLLLLSNKYVMTVDEREHPVFDSTQYDDYDDFSKVVRHLIEVHGYRKIYCLTGPEFLFQAQTRLKAYQDQMSEHGLYFDESYYSYGTFWIDCAIEYAEKIVSGQLSRPEAVVCGNDAMAAALINELMNSGIKVPEDIAVTGYDGFRIADMKVSLTTYDRNHYQLGADSVRRLYRNMTGVLCNKVNRPENGFIIGNSCGCSSVPARQLIESQSEIVPEEWREKMFCDDLAFDLAQALSVAEVLHKSIYHSKKLYKLGDLRIYLDDDNNCLSCKASLESGTEITEKSFSSDDVTEFLRGSQSSEILFLSPLHFGKRSFGIVSLSFAEYDRLYDENYLRFIANTEIALDRQLYTEKRISDDTPHSLRQKEIRQKMTELRQKLMNEPELSWTVDKMSRTIGMGRSTIQKHYKSCFGKSIFEELIQFRVELAKRLLKDTTLSLTEITVRCGYSTESYFMKQFKNVTGSTPTEFRSRFLSHEN